jgi:hypothetical protein
MVALSAFQLSATRGSNAPLNIAATMQGRKIFPSLALCPQDLLHALVSGSVCS